MVTQGVVANKMLKSELPASTQKLSLAIITERFSLIRTTSIIHYQTMEKSPTHGITKKMGKVVDTIEHRIQDRKLAAAKLNIALRIKLAVRSGQSIVQLSGILPMF